MSDVLPVPLPVPGVTAFTADDFRDAQMALLPRGPVWPREPDALVPQVMGALAPTYARNGVRALTLLQDAPAGDLIELLPEWEATLGLPDPCNGPSPTIALRQRSVRAAIAAQGGQSVPYFIMLAAALGFAATITEFAPARASVLRAGEPVYGPDWAHAWRVTLPLLLVEYFRASAGAANEPLATWGSDAALCTLSRYKPAQTILIVAYS